MAEFKDISEFILKPVLDGNEEIQISAEYKTSLLRIAGLVLSNLFTLDGFNPSDTGFGPILAQNTLLETLQKINLGFANGQARIITDPSSYNIVALATTKGIVGFDYENQDIEIYAGSIDLAKSDNELLNELDVAGDIITIQELVKEYLDDSLSNEMYAGYINWTTQASSTSRTITIFNNSFKQGVSSSVLGGMTETVAPTLKLQSAVGWTLYTSSNWASIWALPGTKVITIQRFSPKSNILIANVGLYNKV